MDTHQLHLIMFKELHCQSVQRRWPLPRDSGMLGPDLLLFGEVCLCHRISVP